MAKKSSKERVRQIHDFIFENVKSNPKHITKLVAEKFGISRQASHRHLQKLIQQDIVIPIGQTRNRSYKLKPLVKTEFKLEINSHLHEDTIWREKILPLFNDMSSNVINICEYGFTEMLNNAIDHSNGQNVWVQLTITKKQINITIHDNGVGIFNKIQKDFNLEHPRLAILELVKGKLTTDPMHHTGEGVFFTSRAFDEFSIISGTLFFHHTEPGDDWVLEKQKDTNGTGIDMTIDTKSNRNLQDVFNKYAAREFTFSRTIIPVNLARIGDENLISRSQAKRLLSRFEKFEEIVLDFRDIDTIGQAFADEIFRVFKNEHPKVEIIWTNVNKEVEGMILRAKNRI